MADQIFVIRETPSVVRRGESPVLPNCGDARETPLILQNSTFDSCSADEGDKRLYFRKSHSLASKGHAEDDDDDDDDDGVLEVAEASDHKKSLPRSSDLDFTVLASWKEIASQLFYISSFAILGTVLRVYMGRFFGLDCEQNESGQAVDDFLTPVSILVCVTSDGKMQRGGSVFVDLPANMLGSFIIGLLSPAQEGHPLPWYRADHPLQRRTALHIGIKVGFCGCLTTFSSWNTQMVVMMDGTATEFGSQVAAALFGYLIGVSCAVASFIFGRHVFDWLRSRHPLPQSLTIDEGGEGGYEERARGGSKEGKCGLLSKLLAINLWLVIAVAGLLSAFVAGDAVEGSLFYRKMWMAAALSPFGAVLRWKLAELNSRKLKWTGVEWFPWGTFIANFSAALVSILMEALDLHVVDSGDGSLDWVMPIVQAVEVGFSGSLSTVSTMIRDIFFLQTPGQASIYCSVTILSSMLMSLMIYSPIVRSN